MSQGGISITDFVKDKTWSVRRAASSLVYGRRSSSGLDQLHRNWANECTMTRCLRRFGKLPEVNIRKRDVQEYFSLKPITLESTFGLKLNLEVTGFTISHNDKDYYDNMRSKDLRTLRLEHLKKNPLASGEFFDEHSANIYFGKGEYRELVGSLSEFYTAPPPGNSFTLCLTNGEVYRFEYEETGGCAVYKDKYREAIMVAEYHGIYTDFNLNYRILWVSKISVPMKLLLILCLFDIHEKFYAMGFEYDTVQTEEVRQHQKGRAIHFH